MSIKYDVVENLVNVVRDLKLSIERSPLQIENEGHFYQRVRVSTDREYIDFPIMDEFSDIDRKNPVVLLNSIVQECQFFNEAKNFQEWCKDIGLPQNLDSSKEIYEEIKKKAPQISSIVGPHVKPVNYYDIEFNTGIAQALRAAVI